MAVMINISELKETLELTPSTQNIMLVGKPVAGFNEALPKNLHREVDSASMCSAYEAFVGVPRYGE